MKKIYMILIHLIIIVGFILNIYQYNNHQTKMIINSTKKNNSNLLSMMIENDQGEYEESKSNEFPQEGYLLNTKRSGCENGGSLTYQDHNVYVKASSSERCYVYFAKDTILNKCELGYVDASNGVCTILKTYGKDKTLYYHDEKADYEGMLNYNEEAGDLSYRYSGASPEVNNYVCLDGITKNGNCQTDADLYRIIGIFKNEYSEEYELKLIKATYATPTELGTNGAYGQGAYGSNDLYYWNSSKGTTIYDGNVNFWSESNLNKENLNSFYYNYIANKVSNLANYITKHIWFVAGNDYQHGYAIPGAKTSFNYEIGPNRLSEGSSKGCFDSDGTARACLESDLTYENYIGLMYNSDYYYAADPQFWPLHGLGDPYQTEGPFNDYRDAVQDNWLYLNYNAAAAEWSISRDNDGTNVSFIIASGYPGYVTNTYISYQPFYVRPTFYLASNTNITSGAGTYESPYRFTL